MPTTKPTQRGFTLMEMVVVLVIVAAGFGLLASSISQGLKSAEERQLKRDLSLALRQVRSQAISSGQSVSLLLDVVQNSYQVPGQRIHFLPRGTTLRLTTAAGPDDHTGIVIFYPNGGSSGGHLYVSHGTQQSRIDIEWLTGRVSWQDIHQP
ncbi:GspH/FimT family pseudopilin [Pseudomonas sp. B329]|uniref:GspH/FimT family pseudopilin n=1 Tax=Pseudomonas sp. B329 TaxID=1553459 RepID=UPI0020053A0D|nr:GspH/FimT family pseudopilin [Pseudomonas sp. B329]MCK3863849.1 prepilin-type N-terminal cleavage/methylation domain-containing protein [Pseudomonas sp. B329]